MTRSDPIDNRMENLRGQIPDYTLARIQAGFNRVPSLLKRCQLAARVRALDVGCGAGFDSFALAREFSEVVSLDPDQDAITQARRIASHVRADNLHFERLTLEQFHSKQGFDLIFCNLMSHNVPSRLALLRHLARLLRPGGRLIYAEFNEGYAPRAIESAIANQDSLELRLRLRQVQAGLLGLRAFRFFVADSLPEALRASGLQPCELQPTEWRGRVTEQIAICDTVEHASPPTDADVDPDYLALSPEFGAARQAFTRAQAVLCHSTALPSAASNSLLTLLPASNHFQPFLHLLCMANRLPRTTRCHQRQRWRDAISHWFSRPPNWVALTEIQTEFHQALEDMK